MKTTDNIPEGSKKNNAVEQFAIVTGMIICFFDIAYFLIMAAQGLADVPEYRIFNYIFQAAAIAFSIKYYKSTHKGNYSYLEGFGLGCFSSFISSVLFAGFLFIYLNAIEPDMLNVLRNNSLMLGKYLTPFSAALAVAVEGSIAGLIISLALMQFYKDDALHNPLKKKSTEIE
jgi:hypothetical protein